MLYLRVPQITPVLCQRTKAPVLPSFPCIITTMERKSAVCSLYGGCRGNWQPFLILESIVRHYVSVSKSRFFAIFKQYNVNNVKTKQLRFPLNSGKNVQWCLKAKRYTNFPQTLLKIKVLHSEAIEVTVFCTFFSDSAHGLIIKHQISLEVVSVFTTV